MFVVIGLSKESLKLKKSFKRLANTYRFSSQDINKFILLLRKSVYPDYWEKCNKTSLPEKENFYVHLNMEDIARFFL